MDGHWVQGVCHGYGMYQPLKEFHLLPPLQDPLNGIIINHNYTKPDEINPNNSV
jgi:hypothetical protein